VDLSVTGTPAEQVYAVVLRHPVEDGAWLVARRLSGPGALRANTSLRITAGLREKLDAGEVVVEVFTRDAPFGAARAVLTFPG
jgi:hypothetical protein